LHYPVLISDLEVQQLSELASERLNKVSHDSISVFLEVGNKTVSLSPAEISTPDSCHPNADAVRIAVANSRNANAIEFKISPSTIKSVNILTTALMYSAPTQQQAAIIMGVAVPKGTSYSPIYYHPQDPVCWNARKSANVSLITVDVGIFIETELQELTISTDAVGYFVYLSANEFQHERLIQLRGKTERKLISSRKHT
jgi:hypothetical protein